MADGETGALQLRGQGLDGPESLAHLTAGRLPAALVLAGFAFLPLMTLVDTWRELGSIAAASARLTAILDAEPDVTYTADHPPAGPITPEIAFESVGFRYRPHLPDALRDVSFTVPAGRTIALAGHSGAGKSTCASLALRWWDTTEGVIRIGGHDIRDLPETTLRALIGSVPQDTYLFALTVRDNIRLARPDADDTEVERAARAACAHIFITQDLPDGYDTLLGERGARLSEGQRQRLAIARAGRTTLIVAHRPSTLQTADEVVLLEGGRVIDRGPHHELLDRSPAYQRLLDHNQS